jgi:tetratricopeptide (TPR) repeat protein
MEVTDDTVLVGPTLADTGEHPANSGSAPSRGQGIGRYVVLDELGAGGMGVVVAAYDPDLDRKVAIKLLSERAEPGSDRGPSGTSTSSSRLIREAQALAALRHPNVVTVHDVGSHGGHVFVAMEYVDGITLNDWFERGPHPYKRVLQVLSQAGRGLAAAHGAGLVHRDFKPTNVMLEHADEAEERVLVLDFGLARRVEGGASIADNLAPLTGTSSLDEELTAAGALLGTPAYMAPEQHLDAAVDERTDQHSFCAVLFEALYGIRPYEGRTVAELAVSRTKGRIRAVPTDSSVPTWVHEVVLRGLSTHPDDRWPSMDDLLDALTRDPTPARRRMIAAGSVVGAVALLAGWSVWSNQAKAKHCREDADSIDGTWNAEVAQAGHAAFGATGLPQAEETWARLAPMLDERSEQWRKARLDACTASSRSPDDLQLQQTLVCLDDRQASLSELATLFTEADRRTVGRALAVVLAEPPISDCSDPAFLARTQRLSRSTDAASLEQLRSGLRQARRLRRTGEVTVAHSLLERLLDQARGKGVSVIETDILREMGYVEEERGRYEAAAELLEDAFFSARRQGDSLGTLSASLALITMTGDFLGKPEEGERWARHAEVAIDELGGDRNLDRARLAYRIGGIEGRRGDHQSGLEHAQEALKLATAEVGEENTFVPQVLMLLSAAYIGLRDFDQAVEAARRGLEIYERIVGPDQPVLASHHLNLGVALLEQGELDEARTHLKKVIELAKLGEGSQASAHGSALHDMGNIAQLEGNREDAIRWYEEAAAFRRDHSNAGLGDTLINLAGMYADAGRNEDATRTYHEARAVLEETRGPRHPRVAAVVFNMGNLAYERGELDLAYELHSRALEIRRESYPAKHPWLQTSRTYLAAVAIAQKRFEVAAELAREAIDLADEDTDPTLLHQMKTVYSAARLELGDPQAAIEMLSSTANLDEVVDDRRGRREQRLLAEARFAAGDDAPGARAFIERLAKTLHEDPAAPADEVEAVDRWLREHR